MKNNKFSLVELLVVIVIIGILASIVAGGAGFISYRNKLSYTKAQMKRIEMALDKYKAEYGDYYINSTVNGGEAKPIIDPAEFNPNPNAVLTNNKKSLKRDFGTIRFCSRKENARKVKDAEYTPITFLGENYIYADEEDCNLKLGKKGVRDGWGNLFIYQYPGEKNKTKYDISSRGEDGEGKKFKGQDQDDDDDITNWNAQK